MTNFKEIKEAIMFANEYLVGGGCFNSMTLMATPLNTDNSNSPLASENNSSVPIVEHLYTWAHSPLYKERTRLFYLFGDFGSGKSTVCKSLLKQLYDEYELSRYTDTMAKPILPIYFNINILTGIYGEVEFAHKSLNELLEVMFCFTGIPPIDGDDIIKLVRQYPCVVIFDGFDEAVQKLGKNQQNGFLNKLLSLLPTAQYSRDLMRIIGQPVEESTIPDTHSRLIISCRKQLFESQQEQQTFTEAFYGTELSINGIHNYHAYHLDALTAVNVKYNFQDYFRRLKKQAKQQQLQQQREEQRLRQAEQYFENYLNQHVDSQLNDSQLDDNELNTNHIYQSSDYQETLQQGIALEYSDMHAEAHEANNRIADDSIDHEARYNDQHNNNDNHNDANILLDLHNEDVKVFLEYLINLSINPLLLSLSKSLLPAVKTSLDTTGNINSAQMFTDLITKLMQRDSRKSVINIKEKQKILGALALTMWQERSHYMSLENLRSFFFTHYRNYRQLQTGIDTGRIEIEVALQDLHSSMIVRDNSDMYSFFHPLLFEYFLAVGIFEAVVSSPRTHNTQSIVHKVFGRSVHQDSPMLNKDPHADKDFINHDVNINHHIHTDVNVDIAIDIDCLIFISHMALSLIVRRDGLSYNRFYDNWFVVCQAVLKNNDHTDSDSNLDSDLDSNLNNNTKLSLEKRQQQAHEMWEVVIGEPLTIHQDNQ